MPSSANKGFHTVDDAAVLSNEALALAVWAFRIFLLQRRDCHDITMVSLPAQPPEKGALEKLRIEPIGLRTPVFARYSHTRGMNNMSFDILRSEPTRQLKAFKASFVGNRDAWDIASSHYRLIAPTMQQILQCILVNIELLHLLTLYFWHDAGD